MISAEQEIEFVRRALEDDADSTGVSCMCVCMCVYYIQYIHTTYSSAFEYPSTYVRACSKEPCISSRSSLLDIDLQGGFRSWVDAVLTHNILYALYVQYVGRYIGILITQWLMCSYLSFHSYGTPHAVWSYVRSGRGIHTYVCHHEGIMTSIRIKQT